MMLLGGRVFVYLETKLSFWYLDIFWKMYFLISGNNMGLPWSNGQRHLTENKDLRLLVQPLVMPEIFTADAKKHDGTFSEGNNNLDLLLQR